METPQMKFVKKGLLGLFAIGMMAGCTESNLKTKRTTIILNDGDDPMQVVTIEGCEYLLCNNSHGDVIIHKGNCKNPIHPENKSHE
jgi:hypothetical protein